MTTSKKKTPAKTTTKKATTATTRKTTKPKTPQERLDNFLEEEDEDLEMYVEKKSRKAIAKKSATEEALEMFQTIETGQKIGEAAVENPVFGAAIVFGAAATIWKLCKK